MTRLLVIGSALLVLAAPARAQDPTADVSLGLGAIAFGQGRGQPVVAGRASVPLPQGLVLDAGLSLIPHNGSVSTSSVGADTIEYLIPDLGLNLEFGTGALRPYVGAGASLALDMRQELRGDVGVHAGVGLRLDLSPRWGMRLDGRARSIGAAYGTSREITLAVSWHPGSQDW